MKLPACSGQDKSLHETSLSTMNSPSVIAQPTVSIGLPVYNGGRYLRQALDSLLAQTHKDFELIIGDNASTDETEAICLEFAASDSRIRYFRHHENLGAVRNFLFVFEKARGQFFMWAAHDDLWESNWLEQMHATIASETGSMAYGQVQTIDDTGRPMVHPANNRAFRFDQSFAWIRQLSYFLQYEGLGKANPIYGLFHRADMVQLGFAALMKGSYADCAYLFHVLSRLRMKSVAAVFHYKRVHAASGANVATPQASSALTRYPVLARMNAVVRSLLNVDAIANYVERTHSLERFLLFTAIPLKILFTVHGLVLSYLCAQDNQARASGFSE